MNPILLLTLIVTVLAMLVCAWLVSATSKHNSGPRKRNFRVSTFRVALACFLGGFRRSQTAATVQFANIGEGTYSDGRKSYIPDAATTSRYLLYKKGTDVDHCAITGAGDTPLGPSDDQADAGVAISINLLGAVKGTVRVVTDGTVNDGDFVKAGATGKVTQAVSTNRTFGIAIIPTDCSKADGDVITIIPMAPALYVF